MGSAKPKVVRNTPSIGVERDFFYREKVEAKLRKLLIGYSLKPTWQ